jgi:hypothetical protein
MKEPISYKEKKDAKEATLPENERLISFSFEAMSVHSYMKCIRQSIIILQEMKELGISQDWIEEKSKELQKRFDFSLLALYYSGIN